MLRFAVDVTHCCMDATIAWWGTQVLRACAGGDVRLPLEFGVLEPPGEAPAEPGWREERVEMPRLLSDERRSLWEQFLPVTRTWPEETQRRLSERYTLQVGEIAHVAAQLPETFDDVRRLGARILPRAVGRPGPSARMPVQPRQTCSFQIVLLVLLDEFLFEARDRIRFWEDAPRPAAVPARHRTDRPDVRPARDRQDDGCAGDRRRTRTGPYRIDMASTVNKYIGETAKNLKRLFARAADMNAVLLFDEADALFSKRTEVRDSHDRYANADTNYLLQLIEDYPGVALLATNKRQNIDEAFVRRVRYLMFFPRPDRVQRLAIWRQIGSRNGRRGPGACARRRI